MFVRHAPPEHFPWLKERLGDPAFGSDVKAIEAVDERGEIHGMVAYDHWTFTSAMAYLAVKDSAALRALLVPMFSYPFLDCGREILLLLVPSHAEAPIRLARRLGFVETHRVKDGHRVGDDLVLLEMRKNDCKWLPERKA